MTIKSAVLSAQGRTSEHLAACEELLRRLLQHQRHAVAGKVPDYDAEAVLTLRLTTHGIRILTYIKQGNMAAVADDIRTILRTLPQLATVPSRSIRSLMVAGFALGMDRMVALIRESPSAELLLPLTTVLDWETGKDPRVAAEVRKVAEDMRREFAEVREHLSSPATR